MADHTDPEPREDEELAQAEDLELTDEVSDLVTGGVEPNTSRRVPQPNTGRHLPTRGT